MRRPLLIAVATLGLLAAPAQAGDDKPATGEESLGEQVDRAVERVLETLRMVFDRFPGYAAPEVTPEGDIIIRKLKPEDDPDPPPGESSDRVKI